MLPSENDDFKFLKTAKKHKMQVHYNMHHSSRACVTDLSLQTMGAQWLSGRLLDSRPRGPGFEPHRRHCVVALEQDTFILV